MTVNEIQITEIKQKIVAIVKFGPAGFATDGTNPGEYYQVTISPEFISPSGEFIRFGQTNGDEITGWQRAEAITIIEILGLWRIEFDEPVLKYGTLGVVNMPVLQKVQNQAAQDSLSYKDFSADLAIHEPHGLYNFQK